jgi:hypothetical protein
MGSVDFLELLIWRKQAQPIEAASVAFHQDHEASLSVIDHALDLPFVGSKEYLEIQKIFDTL